jgi:hypothetical protein
MRRLLVVAVAAALALPAAAPAKLQGELRVCGASGCAIVDRHEGHERWELLGAVTGGSSTGPARPGPFYELTVVPTDRRGRVLTAFPLLRFYYAPRAERIRATPSADTGDGAWRTLAAPPPELAAAVRKLRPFPAPILVRVEVGGRLARDPHSYLRLFRFPAPKRGVADPAGPYPRAGDDGRRDIGQIAGYWRRVQRHWLPVNLWSRRPSPWGDDSTSLWVARRLPLVKRDGEIARVPRAVAARIRAARSLHP